MLAKLIVKGENREDAIARLEQALMEFHVLGVRTNIPYLLAIIRHPEFRAGHTKTSFLNDHFRNWKPNDEIPEAILLALAAESMMQGYPRSAMAANGARTHDPWNSNCGWRNAEGERSAPSI